MLSTNNNIYNPPHPSEHHNPPITKLYIPPISTPHFTKSGIYSPPISTLHPPNETIPFANQENTKYYQLIRTLQPTHQDTTLRQSGQYNPPIRIGSGRFSVSREVQRRAVINGAEAALISTFPREEIFFLKNESFWLGSGIVTGEKWEGRRNGKGKGSREGKDEGKNERERGMEEGKYGRWN